MTAVLVLLMVGLVSASITCPNGTQCQDKNTCCATKTGYACCQYPSAVCCEDQAHCCPQGYRCDLETRLCEKKGLPWDRVPLSAQIPTQEEKQTAPFLLMKSGNTSVSVVYCGQGYFCPGSTTCCRSFLGRWTCCIYRMGRCCLDGYHCCPFGYFCSITSTYCVRGALRLPASPQIAAVQSNTLQDQCCLSESGCCPIGFHCDEDSKACVRDFHSSPLKSGLTQAGIIHCSDRFYCPAGHHCCKSQTGQLACCPYPLGQCCKDGKHCCQYGYDCDSTFTKCKKGYASVPALLTKEAQIL